MQYLRAEILGINRNIAKVRVQMSDNDDICLYIDADRIISLEEGTIPISWIRSYAAQFPEDCFPFQKMIERWQDD